MIFFVARLRAAVLRAGDEALLAVFFFAFATCAREALPVAFFTAVRTRETPPGSGEQALAALRTALRVVAAIPPLDELR